MEKVTIKILSNSTDFNQIQLLMKNNSITFDVICNSGISLIAQISGSVSDLFHLFYVCGFLTLLIIKVDL